MFSCFVFLILIFYLKRQSKLLNLEWDIQTITAGDYTVEFEIQEKGYKWFLENVY